MATSHFVGGPKEACIWVVVSFRVDAEWGKTVEERMQTQ